MEPLAPAEPPGSPAVSEEQLDLLPTLDLRQEMPPPHGAKPRASVSVRLGLGLALGLGLGLGLGLQ